eukprot:CAMPEP_0172646820 /NCGR_PEP_ID=MMETSP1068-20121228/240432_1 /TAXON_ID=35684 /ORGANISM="Pseudopedinella elastica, Strain CCMP716" /LENGTH=324 /DNA_ID=CAMNT_0013461085 /DNA_START=44 /DNA_END=1018 /DNA_ORIENTATION=+
MAKDKKEKKEKKVKAEAEPEEVVEKKDKKDKKKKRKSEEPAAAEPEVEDKKAAKKEKKEKKRKAEEEAAAAEVEKEDKKKSKKSKKAKKEAEESKEETASTPVSEEEEEPTMKVHKKEDAATPKAGGGGAGGTEPSCEVFMGNLSWQIDEASLQEAFKACGVVQNCKWLEDRETGKFKGCGFITFATVEEAGKAVAMDGTEVLGRPVKCNYSTPRAPRAGGAGGGGGEVRPMQAKPDGCTTLFAGNLSFDIDDDQMKDFFKDCGEVSAIRWLTDRESGQFKGCGFIEFSDPDASLDLAAKKNGQQLLGRQVRLDFAAPKKPREW